MKSVSHQGPKKKLLSLSVAMLLAGVASNSQASGFQLYSEANAVSQGNYAAGAAAEASDASIGFYNPAGLTRIKQEQWVFAGNVVSTKDAFYGTATWNSVPATVPFVQTATGVDGGGIGFVPALHYAKPLGENLTFGFSITSPFGLTTDYGETSAVRYAATKTSLITVDISPEIGGKITDKLSLGLGIDFQLARVTYNGVGGVPIAVPSAPTLFDSMLHNQADSLGVGAHIGLLYEFTPTSRIGINYQSEVSHHFQGDSSLSGPIVNFPTPISGTVTSDVLTGDMDFPATTTLSAYHEVNDKLALLGSVVYTQWDTFKTISLQNVASVPTLTMLNVPQNFKNTWRFAAGVNYKLNDKVLLRAGGGYDQSPTNIVDRSLRLPDDNRYALAIGTRVNVSESVSLDAGWTHFFIKDVNINNTLATGTSSTTTTGIVDGGADIFAAQLNWTIT